ncbi:MAG TPA: DinB family protein [Pyrinomonadaceae bacterium]|jgi:uncharacterized damage-inducible protein DinB
MGNPNKTNLYLIAPLVGYTPQIGRLVSMMNYARRTTLDEVEDLSVEHLDYLHDPHSNSIGALLLHIAAVEAWYQVATFGSRAAAAASKKGPWGVALELGARSRREIKGNGIDYYLRILEEVRSKTLEEFGKRNDQWLDEETPFWDRQPANNYFKWFHVFEDEINHRGQIRWLRKRAVAK